MRISLMSDLHLEFEPPSYPSPMYQALDADRRAVQGHPQVGPLLDHLRGEGLDLIIMAGDIATGINGIAYAEQVSLMVNAPVAFVMGNHDAYGSDLADLLPRMRERAAEGGRVIFLENNTATFDVADGRYHVLGCTFWTDYALNGDADEEIDAAMHYAARGLNDHRRILMRGSPFTPVTARGLHQTSRTWLAREVARIRAAEGEDAKIIIATHHAPIREGGHPQFRGNSLDPAFASDLTKEINAWSPLAWVFGHTHHTMNMVVGKTRVMAAQRGYVGLEIGAENFRAPIIDL